MRLYLSGPISAAFDGTDIHERKARFYRSAEWLKVNRPDWDIVNPLDVRPACEPHCDAIEPEEHSWSCWMRHDLHALLDCDAIGVLPGWQDSPGALLETRIARELGMMPFYFNKDGVLVA